ncbi:hypothetical protein HGA34_02000 [Candidatus Falkowbacteria bacterium]|nr:hypothetical protein [Candidatus Falkowbacteria bacterium]
MSFDYLRKFNELPAEVKAAASSPEAMASLDELEEKYHVNLASLVMRILVKEVRLAELDNHLLIDLKMGPAEAVAVAAALREKILSPAMKYLMTESPTPVAKGQELVEIEHNLPDAPANHSHAEEEVLDLSQELKELNREKTLQLDLKTGRQDDIFNEEDETEIKVLTEQMDVIEKPATDPTEENLSKLIEECKISFSSQILVDRFRQIFSTYLKGIRKKIETKDAMLKPIEAGGLNLDDAEIERIMQLAQKYVAVDGDAKMEQPKKIVLPEDKLASDRMAVLKEIGARDVEYDLGKAIEERKNQAQPSDGQKAQAETAAPQPAPAAPVAATIQLKPQLPAEPAKKTFSFFRNSDAIGKKKMEDVKFVPKTMGPIDELRFMDTVSFRRLGKVAAESTAKLRDKITLLEKEQYAKKLEGIKAWRQSPLNQLYVSMTQNALSQGLSIDQVITQKSQANEDCLNQAEFEAIMKLNQELRF